MRRCAWLFILLLSPIFAFCQKSLFESYTPANGLIDARINKIFQDSKGRMYFLTRDGFSIYDGRHFDNYSSVDGSPVGIASDIIENSDQSITIFTFWGSKIHVRNNVVSIDTSMQHDLMELNRVIRISEKDILYITNHRLVREKDGKIILLHLDRNKGNAFFIDNAAVSGDYLVYSDWDPVSKGKLFFYDYQKQRSVFEVQLEDILNFQRDNNGDIFFYKKGWHCISSNFLNNGKIEITEPWFNRYIPTDSSFSNLNFDNEGNAWFINYSKGCVKVDRKTGYINRYFIAEGLNYGLSQVFQDKEKNYWFISLSQGVQKLLQSGFSEINTIKEHKIGTLSHINNTENGNCFLGAGNGAFIIDKEELISQDNDRGNFCYWMKQLWQLKDFRTLKGSGGTTIDLSKQLKDLSFYDNQISFKTSIDRYGRLLIVGRTLVALDRTYQCRVKRLPYFSDDVLVDDENNYWCFLRSDYLVRLNWDKDSLSQNLSIRTPGLNPRCALIWNKNSFLVGTRYDGVHLVQISGDKVTSRKIFGKANGLSNDFIQAILKRNDDELVIGTATGLDLVRFREKDTVIEKISARNNVFSAFPEIIKDPSGNIYARADDETLYKLEKTDSVKNDFVPSLDFRAVSVNGKPVKRIDKLSFNYRENNFIFSASAPSFLDNKNIRFLFSLTNGKQAWEQNSESADFSINNLEPGSYKLRVTVLFPGRIYNNAHLDYAFQIQPPIWKSWWFIATAILIATVIVVLFLRSYFRRQLEKQRLKLEKREAIEKERTRIATDMHDDFGATLTRIKFLSEKLQLEENKGETLHEDLTKISAFSDEMSEKMGEIVWALNQRYDSTGDLVSFCRSYASEFLEDKNIELDFSTGMVKEVRLNGEIRRNIFLTLKESLNNIVKHSGATKVNIEMSCDAVLRIVVCDNGRGFDPAAIRPFANGIMNMKKRIEEIDGSFTIEAVNGSRITILVNTDMPQNTYE